MAWTELQFRNELQESNRFAKGPALDVQTVNAVNMKIYVFWDMTPYNLVKMYRGFGGTNFLYFQSKRVIIGDGSSFFSQNIGISVRDHTTSYSADSTFQIFSVSISCVAVVRYSLIISLAGKGGQPTGKMFTIKPFSGQ
jgi:hypothetical protein